MSFYRKKALVIRNGLYNKRTDKSYRPINDYFTHQNCMYVLRLLIVVKQKDIINKDWGERSSGGRVQGGAQGALTIY